MDLKDKRCIVSGASSGIGLALINRLAALGAVVLAVDIEPIPVKGITGIKSFSADLSNQEGVDALFEEAAKELGEIDIFIANAGFAYCERTDTPDWNHIKRIFELNVISPIYSLEKLRAAKGNKPFFFITTASAMSFMSLPGYAIYGATKAALRMFNLTAAYELSPGQRIATIYPVATRTKFFNRASTEYVPWPSQDARKVACAIINGIKGNKTDIFPFPLFKLINAVFTVLPFAKRFYLKREWLNTGLHIGLHTGPYKGEIK
jgi:short-subunit dehydrogenase